MGETTPLIDSTNFTALNINSVNSVLSDFYLNKEFDESRACKIFLGEKLNSKAVEISYNVMKPGAKVPFYHSHKQNEEVYIFISGEGEFEVDDATIKIGSGTVVRVGTPGKRTWRNTSNKSLVYLVIQSKEGSLVGYETSDGILL
jgi:mannose-6-phosphate isomerase-like protein (cupin superfamily)